MQNTALSEIMFVPQPDKIAQTQMFHYWKWLQTQSYREVPPIGDYQKLHAWSVTHAKDFWVSLFDFFKIIYTGKKEPVNPNFNFGEYHWFPNVKLNFAQNLLSKCSKIPQEIAFTFLHESGARSAVTYFQLQQKTHALVKYLKPLITSHDVVAAYMPNIPQTAIAMLATATLGATFTSTSVDFGITGVVDRFAQSRPKVLIMAAGYEYNGKYFDLTNRVMELKELLPTVEKIILVDFLDKSENEKVIFSKAKFIAWWDHIVDEASLQISATEKIEFIQVPFAHPMYIMYSSGTTGRPKCIVHSVGGTLLQHFKELSLHTDITEQKKILYFTTCGWMMWNWLISAIGLGAHVYLYEGSPAFPTLTDLVKKINDEQIHIWGTSPKFLRALEVSGFKKSNALNFSHLETILSTGSPLLAEQFDFVYREIKSDVLLSSISGGTDIISCFMLGNPMLPVVRGEIQCLGLGMNVACYNEQGKSVIDEEGELVCLTPFPSTPIGFLNDCNDEKFKEAYFQKYSNIWHHGDFILITRRGTVKVLGRSDATLNPGGVRIGTGEIYRQVEKISWIEDALCVAKNTVDGDVEIILFVKLFSPEKVALTQERISEIKQVIKKNTTPRHVPQQIFAVKEIPYTMSGKKMELVITRLFNGRAPQNLDVMMNPQCLDEYKKIISTLN